MRFINNFLKKIKFPNFFRAEIEQKQPVPISNDSNHKVYGFWVKFSRSFEKGEFRLFIEPDALSWEMPKGAEFHVFLPENYLNPDNPSDKSKEYPIIVIHEDGIQIFSNSCVVYMDGEELWNWPESGVTYDPHLFFTEKELEDIRRKMKSQEK